MAHVSDLIAEDIELYLRTHENKSLLRFITCGSVDDGKSTLIGRLLYESKMLFEDQLSQLEFDSKKAGTQAGDLDFALLVDGLAAEREQGITIDVAYRFFSTDKRKFIVADTPGHEQYTRNMITGASTADVAVILIDARKGVLTQTRRHSYLVSLIGIRYVVLAINKLDMVGYAEEVFNRIDRDYRAFAKELGLQNIVSIPMSALRGDNITELSANTPWYRGATLMGYLENIKIEDTVDESGVFRMPVQWVNRPNLDFRGYSGLVVRGSVKPGDSVCVLPSGKESRVARIVTQEGDLEKAVSGQSITLTLTDEIDISRGDVLATTDSPPGVANQFEATVVWMTEELLLAGRPYLMKIGTKTVTVNIFAFKHKVNVNTLERIAATQLELNEIGICNLAADQLIAFDPYSEDRDTGGFIMIDRLTNNTVGAGMLHSAVHQPHSRAAWQTVNVNKQARAALKGQKPFIVWFSGLSGGAKSTIAILLERKLYSLGKHTYLLDGDIIRQGLNKDLGFTDADRIENTRRMAEVAKLMVDAGQIVLVSPFVGECKMARELMAQGEFFEVLINAPIEVVEALDPKGLYKSAHSAESKNLTGSDSPDEASDNPEIRIDTVTQTPEQAVEHIIGYLMHAGILS